MKSFFMGLLALPVLVGMAGCAQQPGHLAESNVYCSKIRGSRVCATGPLPSAETERLAKRFAGRPDALSIYLLRNSLSDRPDRVTVLIDGRHPVTTIPAAMVLFVVPAGAHELELLSHGQERKLEVYGRNGEVVFADIILKYGWVDHGYRLRLDNAADARLRAERSKLIADVDWP
jgi:hypothetical protein